MFSSSFVPSINNVVRFQVIWASCDPLQKEAPDHHQLILCRMGLMLQAASLVCHFFDFSSPFQNSFTATEIGISGGYVIETFMQAVVIVIVDESPDLEFKTAGQEIVFQRDPVFERLMPAFYPPIVCG